MSKGYSPTQYSTSCLLRCAVLQSSSIPNKCGHSTEGQIEMTAYTTWPVGLLDTLFGRTSTEYASIVFVDAENAQAEPDSIKASIESHFGASAKHLFAYSKWSANSSRTKVFRNAGFRLVQADSGENNADIMMSLDAYEMARNFSDRGIKGVAYICFHSDKGFTHLLEKIKSIHGWKSVWVTSNKNKLKIIQSSSSEVLTIPTSVKSGNEVITQLAGAPESKSSRVTASPSEQVSSVPDREGPESARNGRAIMSIGEYVELILSLIGNDTINTHLLSSRIRAYQIEHNWDDTGKESLFSRYGIPKKSTNAHGNRSSMTIKRSIELYLPGKIEITGTAPHYLFKVHESQ